MEFTQAQTQTQSQLETLTDLLNMTSELLVTLETRLLPVSSPQPIDGTKADMTPTAHVSSAVLLARQNKDSVRYLIDTLVI